MDIESHESPVLKLGGLRIWVHGRQFPEAVDPWDGNWLRITASCSGNGTKVVVTGPVLDTVSFLTFEAELKKLHAALQGEAHLASVEPNLSARVTAQGKSGRMVLRVEMTPDHLNEGHWFEEAIDQSYLPTAIAACREVLERFPVRHASDRI